MPPSDDWQQLYRFRALFRLILCSAQGPIGGAFASLIKGSLGTSWGWGLAMAGCVCQFSFLIWLYLSMKRDFAEWERKAELERKVDEVTRALERSE